MKQKTNPLLILGDVGLDPWGNDVFYTGREYCGNCKRLSYMWWPVSPLAFFSHESKTDVEEPRYTASAELVPRKYRARVRHVLYIYN